MKLRIKGNSLRMRLTKSEIAQIKNGEAAKEVISFGLNSKLAYVLEPSSEVNAMEARFENQTVRVQVPRSELLAWATGSEVSLKHYQSIAPHESLFILIEKDFFCLKPRVHEVEDETDLFENPNEAHGRCGGETLSS